MLRRLYRRVPLMRTRWSWWSDRRADVNEWAADDDGGWGVDVLWGLLTDSEATVMAPGIRVIVCAGVTCRQATVHLPKIGVG